MYQIEKIKVGTRFWLSNLGVLIGLVGIIFFFLFLAILYTGKGLPVEMSLIYYAEVMHEYVYYGFGISILTSLLGFWLAERRLWTKTDLTIDGDRLEFSKKGKIINLPRQRILKLVLLKPYFLRDNKVRIKTIGLKKYIVRMENDAYNKLIDIYSDRFYQD